MPKVRIPPPYRGPTRGLAELSVEGRSVLECLEAAEREFPGFLAQVIDESGGVRRFVKLFKNGKHLQADALVERLAGEDELEIMAAIAGG